MNMKPLQTRYLITIQRPFRWFLGLVVLIGLVGIDQAFLRNSCSNYKTMTGQETQFLFLDQCYILVEGDWMPFGTYELTLVAREGLSQ